MRNENFPFTFLMSSSSGINIKVNGYDIGYSTINYQKHGVNSDLHSVKLDSSEVKISDFPKGKGYYDFWLGTKDSNETSIENSVYLSLEPWKDVMNRISGYILGANDNGNFKSIIDKIENVSNGYTKAIVDVYRAEKEKQPDEIKAYYQFINAAERYENAEAIYLNQSNIGSSTNVSYVKGFSLIPGYVPDSINVYQLNEYGKKQFVYKIESTEDFPAPLHFAPGELYYIDLLFKGELILELVHYQFDDEASSLEWNQILNNISYSSKAMSIDIQISANSVDLTQEDKKRLLAEAYRANSNAFMPRLKIDQSTYHDGKLTVTIDNWELLKALKKNFYVSVKEPDQFYDLTFSKRYLIDGPTVEIDSYKDFLDEELIFYIEDEKQQIASPFTRFDLGDDIGDGSTEDYVEKQNAVEINDYMTRYLNGVKSITGEGDLFRNISALIHSDAFDSNATCTSIFYNLLVQSVLSPSVSKYADNFLYFTTVEWFQQHNFETSFFRDQSPKFINSLDEFIFPTSNNDYALVVADISAANGMTANVSYNFYPSSPNKSITVNVSNGDMYFIFAIRASDYCRSGFIMVNNMGEREYFTYQLNVEATGNG